MSEIPIVMVLDAIKPANSGSGEERLVYKGLSEAVDKYRPTNSERAAEVWASEAGSLEELSSARELAGEYLLRTADKTVNSRAYNSDLWADRFTGATTELYGEPDRAEAIKLLTIDYRDLLDMGGDDIFSQPHVNFLLATFQPIIGESSNNTDSYAAEMEREKAAIHEYGKAIIDKYKPLLDLVSQSGKTKFNPKDLHELFSEALDWLKEHDDPTWRDWEIIDFDGTSVTTVAEDRQIKIPSEREDATIQDARALIAHELLVHAMRAKNGYKTDDVKLATGLPGSLDVEEGLGVLSEEAVNGTLVDKLYDGYLDIALALGTIDGIQRNRQEIFQISFAEQLLWEQKKGTYNQADIPSIELKVWGRVDRIYRGGRGDSLGTRQAIFTKDIAYYVGYKQMAAYISEQLLQGVPAAEIFHYLSQAKIDPNNHQHAERLKNAKTVQ